MGSPKSLTVIFLRLWMRFGPPGTRALSSLQSPVRRGDCRIPVKFSVSIYFCPGKSPVSSPIVSSSNQESSLRVPGTRCSFDVRDNSPVPLTALVSGGAESRRTDRSSTSSVAGDPSIQGGDKVSSLDQVERVETRVDEGVPLPVEYGFGVEEDTVSRRSL